METIATKPFRILDEVHINDLNSTGKIVISSLSEASRNIRIIFNLKSHCIDSIDLSSQLKKNVFLFRKMLGFEKVVAENAPVLTELPRKLPKRMKYDGSLLYERYATVMELESLLHPSVKHSTAEKGCKSTTSLHKHRLTKNKSQREEKKEEEEEEEKKEEDDDDDLLSKNPWDTTEYPKYKAPLLRINSTRMSESSKRRAKSDFLKLDAQRRLKGYSDTKLSDVCKNLLRQLKREESLRNYLTKVDVGDELDYNFVVEFEKILKATKINLFLSSTEAYAMRLYKCASSNRMSNYGLLHTMLSKAHSRLKAETKKKDAELLERRKNLILESLTFNKIANDVIKNNNVESMKGSTDKSDEKVDHVRRSYNQSKNRSVLASRRHMKNERRLIEKKEEVKNKVEAVKCMCADTFTKVREEYEKLLMTEETTKKLQSRYNKVRQAWLLGQQDREKVISAQDTCLILEKRRLLAALKLQTWWRSRKVEKEIKRLGRKSTKYKLV